MTFLERMTSFTNMNRLISTDKIVGIEISTYQTEEGFVTVVTTPTNKEGRKTADTLKDAMGNHFEALGLIQAWAVESGILRSQDLN